MSPQQKMTPDLAKVLDAWEAAWNAGDLEKVMSLFAKEFVLSQQGLEDSRFDCVKRGYEYDFKTNPPGARWKGSLEQAFEDGKLAVAISRWEFSSAEKGAKAVLERLRCVDVLQRTDQGWQFVRTFTYPEKLEK